MHLNKQVLVINCNAIGNSKSPPCFHSSLHANKQENCINMICIVLKALQYHNDDLNNSVFIHNLSNTNLHYNTYVKTDWRTVTERVIKKYPLVILNSNLFPL